jgi:glycosyltransferase XagB
MPRRPRVDGRKRSAGRALGVVAIAASAVFLLPAANASTAAAQPAPTTVPPVTGAPTTLPSPTTAPPTTTLPATTEPGTTLAPTTVPPTTPPTTVAATAALPTTSGVQAGGVAAAGPAGPGSVRPPGSPAPATGSSPGPGAVRPVAPLPEPGMPAASGQPQARGPRPGTMVGRFGRGPSRIVAQVIQETRHALHRLSPAQLALLVLLALVSLALTAVSGTTLWWMLHAWRTPQSLAETGFSGETAAPRRSFSLIVPARHEQAVLGATLSRLASSDHPSFEILVVVGDDDPATTALAQRAARRHPDRIRVLVDANHPKNKPKALNTALPACRGQVVGIFDAEDEVHPQLLRHVDARLTETGADVVQGGVQLMNYRANWYSVRNVLEYYFWFRSRLHFHARQRFIPLGGNTVFVRAALLRQAGGWDPECLAEDCELGVRLSSRGARVAVAYDPTLVTREETPAGIRAFLKQRTRWNQGFLQVLRKGEWRRLPTVRQRLLARYTLTMPFLQAVTGLLVPLSLTAMLLLRAPVLAALVSYLPLVPTVVVLVVETVGLREFCRNYGARPRLRDYLRLVGGTLPYQVLLAAAAVRAVARELRGDRGWEKTAHVGAHRGATVAAATADAWATDRTA